MSTSEIKVPYNLELQELEGLIGKIQRPGEYYSHDTFTVPMPRLEVDGVGVIAFPILEGQIAQLIARASRAPYGRGPDTLLDETVRKVWQIPAQEVRLGGKNWEPTLTRMIESVANDLGCAAGQVSAELYKLLIYDRGGFFASHRDTEKVRGMFGTLVVVLPCDHQGGDLIIRHCGREVVVPLSGGDVSDLRVAAFYADCEHEVKPVTQGHRVCLVFNLIQRNVDNGSATLTAPAYESETTAIGKQLFQIFHQPGAPAKLVWILSHQYSPDGLSFDALKGSDSALGKALKRAAVTASCALHLAIIHIEESGPAEPQYHSPRSRYRRWNRYEDSQDDDGAGSSDDFEVVEVSDSSRYLDHWMDTTGRPAEFGRLPVGEAELLPAGALDGEPPDEQRMTEATGNAGATFERSYHRAALVVWPVDQFLDVLLQAGIPAAVPYLDDQISATAGAPTTPELQARLSAIARRIIEYWDETGGRNFWIRRGSSEPTSCHLELLKLLVRLGDRSVLASFLAGVFRERMDGSEAETLIACAGLLGARASGPLLGGLGPENIARFPVTFVRLLSGILGQQPVDAASEWKLALTEIASPLVRSLPTLSSTPVNPWDFDEKRGRAFRTLNGEQVAELLASLIRIGARELANQATAGITANIAVFDPAAVLVPALERLQQALRRASLGDPCLELLWVHVARFILARSERPPVPPADWRRDFPSKCTCEDCSELRSFLEAPEIQEHQFKVAAGRRGHLEGQISQHRLDLTAVTTRTGSPRTLVCQKTTATYDRQVELHQKDCRAMRQLVGVAGSGELSVTVRGLLSRLDVAHALTKDRA